MPEKTLTPVRPAGSSLRAETLAQMVDVPLRARHTVDPVAVYQGVERRRVARSPMAESQRAIRHIDFLEPDAIPTSEAIADAIPLDVRTLCASSLASGTKDYRHVIGALTSLVPEPAPATSADLVFMMQTGQHATPEVHDQFFNIRRVTHGHPAVYLQCLFKTLHILRSDIEETPSTLSAASIGAIADAIRRAIAIAVGSRLTMAPFEWTAATVATHTDAHSRRWIRGHQIFTVLTQALTFGFEALAKASTEGDDARMAQAADFIAIAMTGCAHSLEFTGDYSETLYETVIRTSMEPPFQPGGFSGLLSSDHRHLVRRMKATRPAMDALLERDPLRQKAILNALAKVYESHKHVCSHFVGADKSSLLMVHDAGRSAVDQLDRFKNQRLRAIGGETP